METAGWQDRSRDHRHRSDDHEPFQPELALDGLARDIAVATTAQWFELDPRACFVVDCGGRIQSANLCAREMLAAGSGISSHHGLLSFHCAASQRILHLALTAVCQRGEAKICRLLRADDAQWRMIRVVPTATRASAFVTVSQSEHEDEEVGLLTDGFGFTRTEAAVMAHILAGQAPKEVGSAMDISIHTIRSHLRSIYAKMNVRGLPGAVRLATRLSAGT